VRKLLVIARHEIALQVLDPVVLLLAIAAPLVIAALISLSFGDIVLGRSLPDVRAPVGIVNQDEGSEWGNIGQVFVRALIPDPQGPNLPAELRFDVFSAREFKDEGQARRLVERGELVAALLIPPDFSASLLDEDATVSVYVNGGDDILGAAFEHAVETLAGRISIAEVTVRTTVYGLLGDPRTRTQLQHGMLDDALSDLAAAAALPKSDPIRVQRISASEQPVPVRLADYLAAAIAVLFLGFVGLRVAASVFQEKAQWTLQRVYITPTRPGTVLLGKAVGAYVTGLIQMGALVGGMAAFQRLRGGNGDAVAAINLVGLCVLILAAVAAATGTGMFFAGLGRTHAEAVNYGRASLMLMGLVGGIFFPLGLFPAPFQALARGTFHYWAMNGYLELAKGGRTASILPHAAVLAAMGLLLFVVGSRLLQRRMEFS